MEDLVLGWRSLLLLAVSLHLAIAAALLVRRPYEQEANRYLALLLLVVIGHFTPQMIGFAGFYDRWPQLSFTPFALDLFLGPLVWAYAWALMRGGLAPPGLWLWLPGSLELAYGLVLMVQPLSVKAWWLDLVHRPYIQPLENFGGLALLIAALVASGLLYRRYRSWLSQHSSAAAEFDPRWLAGFLVAMGALGVTQALSLIANAWIGPLTYFQQFPTFIIAGLIFYILALSALIWHGEAFPKQVGPEPIEPAPGEPTPSAPATDWAGAAIALRDRVQREDWHLEPRLSAPDLARRIGTNETYLSRTLNKGAGKNFNRFINEIRIEAVKSKLEAGADDLLALALACGFNSKATFNRVFREIEGVTPSAYRRAHASAPR